MLDKRFLDSFLKVNNTPENMSDAEVTSVLTKAGWSQAEIDSALILLHNGSVNDNPTRSNISFRPDGEFNPAQLSNLLGVDVMVDAGSAGIVTEAAHRNDLLVGVLYIVAVMVLSLALAAAIGIGAASYLEIGPFAQ